MSSKPAFPKDRQRVAGGKKALDLELLKEIKRSCWLRGGSSAASYTSATSAGYNHSPTLSPRLDLLGF